MIIYCNLQGTAPITAIPEVLEKAVSAVVHSLDKATNGELNIVISTANLGNIYIALV